MVFECFYLLKIKRFKEFISILFSTASFGIIPAAIFAGLFGAIPYAVASSYSTSVAGTISAAFPAIGAIVAAIWFKEKLTPLKFIGIMICIVGTGIMYGLSGGGVPVFVYFIASICAVGYALEGCFGYRMMRDDIHSTVATVMRRVYLILIYALILILISAFTNNFSYLWHLISSFDVNAESFPFLGGFVGNKAFIWIVLFLGACLDGLAYILWYYSMEFSGVATAQVLNITYGIWIVLLLLMPPFLVIPAAGTMIGAIVLFAGATIVTKESA